MSGKKLMIKYITTFKSFPASLPEWNDDENNVKSYSLNS